MPTAPTVRRFGGSCHCGAVRFEVDLDLSVGTTRCNCTYCTKHGWWGALVKPDAFRILAGEEALVAKEPNAWSDRRPCSTCGVLPFGRGDMPELGGAYVSINVRCLDVAGLVGSPVRYLDGRSDTWAELAVRPWSDPFVG